MLSETGADAILHFSWIGRTIMAKKSTRKATKKKAAPARRKKKTTKAAARRTTKKTTKKKAAPKRRPRAKKVIAPVHEPEPVASWPPPSGLGDGEGS
jgi:hypothetical protein